jgi:hypothetical protein
MLATVPVIVTYVFPVGALVVIPSTLLIVPIVFGSGEKVTVIVAELLGLIGVGIGFETVKALAELTLPRLPAP